MTRRVLKNEKGSVLNVALLILMLLALLTISLSRSTRTEVKIASNYKLQTVAFYAAEAAQAYAIAHPGLYGSDNIIANVEPGADHGKYLPEVRVGPKSSFTGYVEYLRPSVPPRGSGLDAAAFKAHRYQLTGTGYGPQHAESRVLVGFYRVGY